MQNILIIGAGSAIAKACARRFASAGRHLFLVMRDETALSEQIADLRCRGTGSVAGATLDILDTQKHDQVIRQAQAQLGQIDAILVAHGSLPDQAVCEQNIEATLSAITLNGTATVALLTRLAQLLEQQQSGSLAVITSVAGDRGRESNYVYGCGKAMVSTFLQGLDQRLSKQGIRVIDIKPGFVITPMTEGFNRSGPLWSQPEKIAGIIERALMHNRGSVYAPGFWHLIMAIICLIPTPLFRKLRL